MESVGQGSRYTQGCVRTKVKTENQIDKRVIVAAQPKRCSDKLMVGGWNVSGRGCWCRCRLLEMVSSRRHMTEAACDLELESVTGLGQR